MMFRKILVPVKAVIDYNVVAQIDDHGLDVMRDHVKMSINPFDEIALEEAIRLQEAGHVEEIIVIAIGPSRDEEQLRQALAMGAQRAIIVPVDCAIKDDPLSVAKILQKIVEKEKPDWVMLGKQAIDNDCNQTGQMLAGLLAWPQVTFASEITISDAKLRIEREVDGGRQVYYMPVPGVVTVDLRLNTPRYITLPNIMRAKQKPLQQMTLEDLSLNLVPQLKRLSLSRPKSRQKGRIFHDLDQFLQALDEGGICR
jgi:electron transfer flavoprotein beta subunit